MTAQCPPALLASRRRCGGLRQGGDTGGHGRPAISATWGTSGPAHSDRSWLLCTPFFCQLRLRSLGAVRAVSASSCEERGGHEDRFATHAPRSLQGQAGSKDARARAPALQGTQRDTISQTITRLHPVVQVPVASLCGPHGLFAPLGAVPSLISTGLGSSSRGLCHSGFLCVRCLSSPPWFPPCYFVTASGELRFCVANLSSQPLAFPLPGPGVFLP